MTPPTTPSTASRKAAEEARALTAKARDLSENGATDVQTMSEAMTQIHEASENIARIVKSIDEIAFQTNLLALNAAVEAARAGDAGMGFAVVAEEVRNLAQRSAVAARETAERIEESTARSQRGVEISAGVISRLQEIFGVTHEVAEFIHRLSDAFQEQSSQIGDVQQSTTQIDEIARHNARIAEENASHASGLESVSKRLGRVLADVEAVIGASRDKTEADPAEDGPAVGGESAPATSRSRVPSARNGVLRV
ncbi:MAG: methyl-accepting chemotaxis protein [Opitutales bacterium]